MPSPNGDASSDDADLDALIGRLEQEAARRRAEPSFPIDDEARLSIEMDRQAPDAPGSRLDRLADAAIRHIRSDDGAPGSVSGGRGRGGPAGGRGGPAGGRGEPAGLFGRASRMLAAGDTSRLAQRLDLLASIVSGGLRTASIRLAELDRRLGRIEAGAVGPRAPSLRGPTQATIPDLAVWRERVAAELGSGPGRVLCHGVDSRQWVAALRAGSVDAYDIEVPDDPATETSEGGGVGGGGEDGELATHVEAVPDGSLAAVVLTGMDVSADPPAFQRLVARLGGAARMVIVVSEAPWWWSRRVGSEITDLAPRRPPTPETWIEALTGAGFSATAVYSPDGRTFCAVGRR